MKKAIFSPGPGYHNPDVRMFAGWIGILEMYRQGLEELGYEVFIPEVPRDLIDESTTVSKILSYDVVAASQLPQDACLFLGPPGYSLNQIAVFTQGLDTLAVQFEPKFDIKREYKRVILYVWNTADPNRDRMLEPEYRKFSQPYDKSPAWRWINKRALIIADHIIACSPWVKQTHAELVPEEKISITPWGVDSSTFHPGVTEIPTYPLRVLFVGGDPIRKGLVYLAKALEHVDWVNLYVAGCHWPFHDSPIDESVISLGMVPYDSMPGIMQQCHVICIPTLEDGIACALQEGMASGLVPITTPEAAEVFCTGDHPQDCDVFRADEGFIVNYGNVQGIITALQCLRDNLNMREEMSKAALKCARAFSWNDTKESFKEVITKQCSPF